jgi:short-subunit dehydrogenase
MKKAVVVGASSGIGRELAGILAQEGYLVGITGRRKEKLDALKSERPDSYILSVFDITNEGTLVNNLETLVAELGGLDLLVLSSGTAALNEELDFELEKPTLNTNVIGFTQVADWSIKKFEEQGFGHFAAISSIGGLRGGKAAPAYNASKAYQINYLEGLRVRAKQKQKAISITDIRPGLVDTAMAKGEGLFWVMPPEKVAKQIWHAIRKKKKVAYVSKRWGVMARLLLILPRFIYDRM